MRHLFFTFLFTVIAFLLKAQVTMTVQLSPVGIMQKKQLWNILLVNNGSEPISIRLGLTLLSTRDNRPVMTASSNIITLMSGAKQVKYDDVAPIQYNYMSPAFNVDMSPDGLLPVGNYIACYSANVVNNLRSASVKSSTNNNMTTVGEDCIPLEIQPLSPPLLNQPANESIIENVNPMFSWIPPAPLNLFNDLTYDFILVKMMKGQSAAQALQQNVPEYSQPYVRNIFLNYPGSAKGLDTGITYAWGIIAKNNGQLVTQSEAWSFKVKTAEYKNKAISQVYTKLQKNMDGGVVFCYSNLKLEYNNEANDTILNYRIISIKENKEQVVKSGIVNLQYGQNFIELPIDRERNIKENKLYLFQITNSRREIWSTRFVCMPNNKD